MWILCINGNWVQHCILSCLQYRYCFIAASNLSSFLCRVHGILRDQYIGLFLYRGGKTKTKRGRCFGLAFYQNLIILLTFNTIDNKTVILGAHMWNQMSTAALIFKYDIGSIGLLFREDNSANKNNNLLTKLVKRYTCKLASDLKLLVSSKVVTLSLASLNLCNNNAYI